MAISNGTNVLSTKTPQTLDEYAAERTSILQLREANRRLAAELTKKKFQREELMGAVYQAVSDVVAGIQLAPVKPPKLDKRSKTPHTAIAVLADWQLGKETPTYNSDVCKKRISQLAEKVVHLTQIQRAAYPVNECRIYAVGDICEGELVFPGQAHHIDSSLFMQMTETGPAILADFIRTMLANFQKVHFVGICGNHGAIGGRQRKEYHPETNADRVIYSVTQKVLSNEKRVTWTVPKEYNENHWYVVDTIGEKRYFLFHGDQMRGQSFGGIPFYGFYRALSEWAGGVIPEGFDFALCGHWHRAATLPLQNKRVLYISGSPESDNLWAVEQLKQRAHPSQWLLFAHPKLGITSEHRVWL